MNIKEAFETVKFVRSLTLRGLEDVSDDQMVQTPESMGNSILWNVGHISYYHYAFVYPRYGLEIPLPATYKDLFRGGSSPADWKDGPSPSEVIDHLKGACDRLDSDLAAGKFETFEAMKLPTGTTLSSIEEVLMFHCAHEGMHAGRISAIKKLL